MPPRSATSPSATLTPGTVLFLLAVAVAARAITFGDPVVHVDEEFYFAAARAMWSGALPYVDIWDRKPIGLFLLYLPAAWLPGTAGICAYQAMALAAVVGTAALIIRLAQRAGWAAGAPPAALAYILWLNLADGQGGQAPVFYDLLVAGAAVLLAGDAASWRRAMPAMLLLGIALQIKYSVVFEGAFLGLWAVACRWRAAPERKVAAALGFGAILAPSALVPTLLVAGFYAAIGHFGDFWFANAQSILLRHDPRGEQLANLGKIALILSPLLRLAAAAYAHMPRPAFPSARLLLFGWLGAALVGLLVFGSWLEHYALPVMLPAAICAAGAFARPGMWRWAIPLLAVVAASGQAVLIGKRASRGTPAQFDRVVRTIGSGPGCLFDYSGTPMLYPATGRCALSRYVFTNHLSRIRESGATGVDQRGEVARILARRPAVIVIRPPFGDDRADIRAMLTATIARDYRLTATLPLGNTILSVYAARRLRPRPPHPARRRYAAPAPPVRYSPPRSAR